MGKTSPIVIPLTVDTSGVDRGISNVQRRLRGGAGGVGSGFGTGGRNSHGIGQGGSGGGVLTAATAGVLGGRFARPSALERALGSAKTPLERQQQALFHRFGIRSKIAQDATLRSMRSQEILARGRDQFKIGNLSESQLGSIESEAERDLAKSTYLHDREQRLTRAVRRGQRRKFIQQAGGQMQGAAKYMLGRLGVPEFAAGRIATGVGSPLGMAGLGIGAAAIVGGAAANFQQRQAQRMSSYDQLRGTPYYNIARKAAKGYDKSDQIGWMDKMWFREREAGGYMSKTIEGVGTVFSRTAELVGAVLGGGIQPNLEGAVRARNIIFGNTRRSAN